MYTQRIKKYIGAYAAEMGTLDAIVFTAGIGENSAALRGLICENLGILGIELSESKNTAHTDGNRSIQTVNSKVEVWVIPTNEELEIALQSEMVITQ
jgi:acetate kinase